MLEKPLSDSPWQVGESFVIFGMTAFPELLCVLEAALGVGFVQTYNCASLPLLPTPWSQVTPFAHLSG